MMIKWKWRQYSVKVVIKIERYDYTDHENISDNVLYEVDKMDNKQRRKLHEAIKNIKEETEAETATRHMEWFDKTILPTLQIYAEQTSSILDVLRDKKEIIQATLRNSSGLSFSYDCRCLYMAVIMASYVAVDVEDNDPVLILTYDCRKFVT
jgi:hypothetical protein